MSDDEKNYQFKNVLAFCILMAGEKIMQTSPDYIDEKLTRYLGEEAVEAIRNEPNFKWGLDGPNTLIMIRYLEKWNVK